MFGSRAIDERQPVGLSNARIVQAHFLFASHLSITARKQSSGITSAIDRPVGKALQDRELVGLVDSGMDAPFRNLLQAPEKNFPQFRAPTDRNNAGVGHRIKKPRTVGRVDIEGSLEQWDTGGTGSNHNRNGGKKFLKVVSWLKNPSG